VTRPPLVLASRSPQRRALLEQLRLPFRVAEPDYDEPPLAVPPQELVLRHALAKARSVQRQPGDGPVIGVDTEVVLDDGAVLGKPADAAAARAMLGALAGRRHRVLSGLAILAEGAEHSETIATDVHFRSLDAAALDGYVATGEWHGRAGGYAIQGLGAALVERVEGCYANVVGLPIAALVSALEALDYRVLAGESPPDR
jgi:septum formation protein